eukprot:215079_1
MLLTYFFLCAGVGFLCVLLYWYKNSFNEYECNNGLKFELPPKKLYPFTHRWMSFDIKNKNIELTQVDSPHKTNGLPCIHYIDEGKDKQNDKNDICFLMCHGNPTWSFLYRKIIRKISTKYRTVSMDYPGFGLSTAPKDYTFTTQQQSDMLIAFVKKLNLNNIILVQQDWGGPTGFNFAINTDAIIKGFVIGNTWCWPISRMQRPGVYVFSCIFGGFFGRALGYGYNFVIRNFFREGFYKGVSKEIRYWYDIPFKRKNSRQGTWIWPAQIWDAHMLLKRIEIGIPQKYGKTVPCLLCWGTKDMAFIKLELEKFKKIFIDHKVCKLRRSSHFWQEDEGEDAAVYILNWIKEKKLADIH